MRSAGPPCSAPGTPAGNSATPACTSCHSDDPRSRGQNTKPGKAIEPMAVSVKPGRYTNPAKVEKWFRRNCNQVLGRNAPRPKRAISSPS